MKRTRFITRALITVLTVAALAMVLCGEVASRKNPEQYLRKITINVSNGALTTSHKNITEGTYIVVVRNYGSEKRGVQMSGTDSVGTPFTRYSKFLASGRADKFRWRFSKGETVVKDVISAELDSKNRVVSGVTGSSQREIIGH